MRRLLLPAVIALLAGCAPPASDSPAAAAVPVDAARLRPVLAAALDTLMQQVAAKSADGVAARFTADGVWIDGSTLTPVTGRDSIRAHMAALLGSVDTLIVEESAVDHLVAVSDSEAVTFGHVRVSFTPTGQQPVRILEYTVDHWRREADGQWRVRYESNGQAPAPAAAKGTSR